MTEEIVLARTALLDALQALDAHRESVILVGAQAIYLHTGSAEVALAEYTADAELAIDTRSLEEAPKIEDAMRSAGFIPDPENDNPGAWISLTGIPVDLMVPDGVAGAGRRGVTAPPHSRLVRGGRSGLKRYSSINRKRKSHHSRIRTRGATPSR